MSKKPADNQKNLDLNGKGNRWAWLSEYLSTKAIKSDEKHLLRVLFAFAGEGNHCYATQDDLARHMSFPPGDSGTRRVRRTVARAEEQGLIVVRGKKGRRRCNCYELRLQAIRKAAEFERECRQRWDANDDDCQSRFGHLVAFIDHLKSFSEPDTQSASREGQSNCQPDTQSASTGHTVRLNRTHSPVEPDTQSPPLHSSSSVFTPSQSEDGVFGNAGGWDGGPIQPWELANHECIQRRYEEAVRKGWIKNSSMSQLQFFTLSKYCSRAAKTNPAGFFTTLLKNNEFIGSEQDERWAREKLNKVRNSGSVAEQIAALANFGTKQEGASE